ncbi:MAG TPA: zf-HC2 domain-containing protein, partial [Myxococcales bacterium]|nr:zf-HC2 domain-containing protein [Myxococcales bacterium]
AAAPAPAAADHVVDDLPDYADGYLSELEAKRVERHLEGCDSCRKVLAAVEATDQAFDSYLFVPPPPLDVPKAIADMTRSQPKPRTQGKISRLAAAAVIAVFFGWTVYRFFAPAPPRPSPLPPLQQTLPPDRPRPPPGPPMFAPVPDEHAAGGGSPGR